MAVLDHDHRTKELNGFVACGNFLLVWLGFIGCAVLFSYLFNV